MILLNISRVFETYFSQCGDFQGLPKDMGNLGVPILFPLTTPNPPILNPRWMVRPHEKSSQFPSKETSKVERKELRQLLFDLDQAETVRLFF